jgi:hypothetical protein
MYRIETFVDFQFRAIIAMKESTHFRLTPMTSSNNTLIENYFSLMFEDFSEVNHVSSIRTCIVCRSIENSSAHRENTGSDVLVDKMAE